MRLYEYEAKRIFREKGIPVPKGVVIQEVDQMNEAFRSVSLPVVLKAQVLLGGRGKAGLIGSAGSLPEARELASKLLGCEARGLKIGKLLVEERLAISRELYLSISVDPVASAPVVLACAEGGMEIEEVAGQRPEKIAQERVDIFRGLEAFQARNIAREMGLMGSQAQAMADIISKLYHVFQGYDAELAEINPLAITEQGDLMAADAKLIIDDNSLFRHKEFTRGRDQFEDDLEYEAFRTGLSYIKFDGNIGILCAGAGLTMTTLDLVELFGGKPANFMEFGGANYRNASKALAITLKNPQVKVILILTFGLIARADVIAQGLAQAITDSRPALPIVAAVRGTGEEEVEKVFAPIGIESYTSSEEAVKRAVELASA